jgi:isoquinoline 1-oxidoreductase subunit beta
MVQKILISQSPQIALAETMIHHRPQGYDDPLFHGANSISSAAVGGNMVLSFRLPLAAESSVHAVSLRIDGKGKVFLTLPRLQVLQAVGTSIRTAVAGQLNVSLHSVHLEYASLYAVSADNAPARELTSPDSVRSALTLLDKVSATARVMLIAAAAERWGVNPSSYHAHQGEVILTAPWQKIKYGTLIVDAARRPVPRQVETSFPAREASAALTE